MLKMKLAVCDNDVIFLKQMKRELEDYYGSLEVTVETFTFAGELLEAVEKDPYAHGCVFLDIEMPQMDGMEAAGKLKVLNRSLPVVFLTSHTDLAMVGYELEVFRFLAKPLDRKQLHRVLQALEDRNRERKRLAIWENGQYVFLPLREILYVKSENIYLLIQTEKKHHLIRKKLKELLQELPSREFAKIHRSYLVNLYHVRSFDGKEIFLDNGQRLPVSKGRQKEFYQQLIRYLS